MDKFTQVIQQIKENDLRTAALTREMKEMEAQIKIMENEQIQMVASEAELLQNIAYKQALVDNKTCEKKLLQNQLDMLTKMLDEAEAKLEAEKTKLENDQHGLWEIRINFSKSIDEFLTKNDYLITNRHEIKELVERRKAAKKKREEVAQLERSITSLEEQYRNQKSQLDILEQLKIDKEVLENEPTNGVEFKRLKNKIEVCLKEVNKHKSTETDQMLSISQYLKPDFLGPEISITSVSAATASQVAQTNNSTELTAPLNSELSIPDKKQNRSVFIVKFPSNIVKNKTK